MGVARALAKVLDRPGGRTILAHLARARTGVRVEFDDRWMRVLPDGLVLADARTFPYYLDTLRNSVHEVDVTEAAAREHWFFAYSPEPDHVILDIGAGSGIETRVFASAVPRGRVFAVEAHPETFARLAAAVRRNGWTNVTPIFAAVTDNERPVRIEDRGRDLANALTGTGAGLEVPGTTLDALCAAHGITRVAFLKMNIEGAERLAIRGMERTLAMTERLCIACHDFRVRKERNDFFATKALVTEYLQAHGFRTAVRADHPRGFVRDHVYAWR